MPLPLLSPRALFVVSRETRRWRRGATSLEALESRIAPAAALFGQFADPHPAAGNSFGASVVPLATGNVVITAPNDDAGGTDAGAVYLFNGATGALISTLVGSHVNDHLGNRGVTALSNGNFTVQSPDWDNGSLVNAGAVTWGSGHTGVSGVVTAGNSLVGSHSNDQVGVALKALPGGNYVVATTTWDNGTSGDAGAVTWGNGATGIVGAISAGNSLVGSRGSDRVGAAISVLSNGNYVVVSNEWDNGSVANAGAVTWGSGSSGVQGTVSAANSLVGSRISDNVGGFGDGVYVLTNGNYVVRSQYWDNGSLVDAGAVTWGNGTSGVVGTISAGNSLVGTTAGDMVGADVAAGVVALSDGNYVVTTPQWSNGAKTHVGAVTWGNGSTGTTGTVSASNSLIGTTAGDFVGGGGAPVSALRDGHYVVGSPQWHNIAGDQVGASTWIDGGGPFSGTVNPGNSLVGSTANDYVGGTPVTVLTNGNYVVNTPGWSNGAMQGVGAATWGSGAAGIHGTISVSNSLVGATAGDRLGAGAAGGVYALSNGNYVVDSSFYHSGAAANVGAVTWGNGASGTVGVIGASNSLVGSAADDLVGSNGVTVLANGNYVVLSPGWSNFTGAATWGSGTAGVKGAVTSLNSLVGSTPGDRVGIYGIALSNGNYVINSSGWQNGDGVDVGAITWGSGATGIHGAISAANSLIGSASGDLAGALVVPLSNGNYVVLSPQWDHGADANAGAMTWGNGASGIHGIIGPANSAIGGAAGTLLTPALFVDDVNGTFLGSFVAEGKVRVGLQATGFDSSANAVSVSLTGATAVGEDTPNNLFYTFSRTGDLAAALTVKIDVGGTAAFVSDYSQTGAATYKTNAGTVTFAAGSATATVVLNPNTDALVENDETATLTVAEGAGYLVGASASATGTILTDDTEVSVSTPAISTAEDGPAKIHYTFTRAGLTAGSLTAHFQLSGTASYPADYQLTGASNGTFAINSANGVGSVTFSPGATTLVLEASLVADNFVEAEETAIVSVTYGADYHIAGTPAVGKIANDDSDVKIQLFGASSVSESGAANLVYTLTRTGFLGNALTVKLNVGGTASRTGDYTHNFATFNAATGAATAVFAANQNTATVTIDPIADAIVESNETVILSFVVQGAPVSSGGYWIASPSSATGTIVDG